MAVADLSFYHLWKPAVELSRAKSMRSGARQRGPRGRGGTIMGRLRSIALAASAAMLGNAATAADYGPEPRGDSAHAITEAALRAKMIDPASTRISWPYRFVRGYSNRLFGETSYGWWTCGRINSKSAAGDYVGETWFVVMLRDGAILSLDRGNSLEITYASALCNEGVKTGKLRPAAVVAVSGPELPPAAVASAATPVAEPAPTPVPAPAAPPPGGGIGIGFIPTAWGAVIQLVVPGSPAARAGLKPGQVIEAVNGMPLKGLAAPEMIKAVRAETPAIFYSIINGGDVKVLRADS